jgi:hypothetical protein
MGTNITRTLDHNRWKSPDTQLLIQERRTVLDWPNLFSISKQFSNSLSSGWPTTCDCNSPRSLKAIFAQGQVIVSANSPTIHLITETQPRFNPQVLEVTNI